MALIYKVTTEERVILRVSAEGLSYYLWLRCERLADDGPQRCRQLERFLYSMGMVYVVLSWEVNEE